MSDRTEPGGAMAWMARNSIAANLVLLLLVGGGIWAAFNIQKEVFPEFELDIVEVSVGYPGAAPAEVEQGILLPVEEAILAVQGIREVSSRAREGEGTVTIELVSGADRMKAFQDVDQAVSRIRTFPDDIEQPEVRLQSRQRQVMQVGLYGDADVWTLRVLAERLRDRLRAEPAITQVEINNALSYVTHVEISQSVLRQYGLTLEDVASLIQRSSADIPAGAISTRSGEVLLRLKERRQWADEFGSIEIVAAGAGGTVTLADIATIRDGFEDVGFHGQFNQQSSFGIRVYRIGEQAPLEIAEAVRKVLAEFEATLPPGVQVRIDSDSARDFRERLGLLSKNGLQAVVIVLLILALFLEFRLAFWVMAGMVASFLGAMMLLPIAGVSINMVSMFGFIVVLGIVVDDAVVIGENIYEKLQEGLPPLRAAIEGAREISAPVVFSILTNIVAFIPLLFMPGTTGLFWWPVPMVVIIVLAVSLIEALFVLPAHLAHERRRVPSVVLGLLHRGQRMFARGFQAFVETVYARLLGACLRMRYLTCTLAVAALVLVSTYAQSDHMGMITMPEVAADEIEAGVRLPVGTTVDQAAQVARDVTEATHRMFEKHDLYRVAHGIKTNVRRGGSFVDVEIVMKRPDERDMTAAQVIELWRDEIGDLPGVRQISFEAERGPGGHRPDLSIDLGHTSDDVLQRASAALVARLEQYANTRDVEDNFDAGKSQVDLVLRPEARAYGLTARDIGTQIRGAFFGALATRQLRGTNEFEVRVKLPEEEREDLHYLDSFVLRTGAGMEVPLADVVDFRPSEAFASINRRNGRRAVTVSGDVEPKRAIGAVMSALRAEVLPELMADYPGLTYSFEGSQAETRESAESLWSGLALALAVIYALLAIAFRSYIQPFIVLVAIPFGIVGAVLGHMYLGFDLSLVSLMGVIALSGVVVNDSLLLVDCANRMRGSRSAFAAVRDAGVRRFRPIFLTTATTAAGLTPIILEKSLQAQHLIPMAISLGFGIVFATLIILVLVPCLYLVVEDLIGLVGRKRAA